MRSMILCLSSMLVLVSCQGRHIDYSAGAGPQGGPGYKDIPSYENDQTQTMDLSISPDVQGQDFDIWPFTIEMNCGGASMARQFSASVKDRLVSQRDVGGIENSHVTCMNELCNDLEVTIPQLNYSMASSWGVCNLHSGVMKFRTHVSRDCALTGKFDGEPQRIWARGSFSKINVLDFAGDPKTSFYAVPGRAVLETEADLAPQDARLRTLTGVSLDSAEIDISLRLPTRARDGAVLNLYDSLSFAVLNQNSQGDYVGKLRFRKYGSSKIMTAELNFSCR